MGIKANLSQKGQQVPNFTEDQAREFFEQRRWPHGPACVHCGSINVYRLMGQATRPGLLECRDCRKQFTVTVGTVMEDSHLPLSMWAKAFHLITSSKKGMSALQLQRNLGIGSYRTAWFLAHRIREAMRCEPVAGALKGVIEADETYVGGKPRRGGPPGRKGRGTSKAPVVVLVERGGRAHCQPVQRVDTLSLRDAMKCVDKGAKLYTDELPVYKPVAAHFAAHETVNHGNDEFVRGDVNTNSAESFFSLLKRGVYGTFHHISRKHMHRYCDEFAFRWTGRDLMDTDRRDEAIKGAEGKRLYYKTPVGAVQPHDGEQLPFWAE